MHKTKFRSTVSWLSPDMISNHEILSKLTATLTPINPNDDSKRTRAEASSVHFKIKPATKGKIIQNSWVHHQSKAERRTWKLDNTTKSKCLNSSLPPLLMVHAQSSINKPLSPFRTENSPVTSALAFGGSGSPGWVSELCCCSLEDESCPNAVCLGAALAEFHFSVWGRGTEKFQSFKAFQPN